MLRDLLFSLTLIACIASASETLLWQKEWSEGFANCDAWRKECRAIISKPGSVDLFKMCKTVPEGAWRVVKVGCPDPADPTGAGEGDRVLKINHDLQYLNVMTYDHLELDDGETWDQRASMFRVDCTKASIAAGIIDPHSFTGFCSISKNGSGLEAKLACPVGGIPEKYGWRRVIYAGN